MTVVRLTALRRALLACIVVGVALNGGALAGAAPSEWNEADTPAILPLNSVSCSSATFCVAVGGGAGRFTRQIQIAMYDGTTWSRVRKPLGRGTILASVSCVSETFCMAVGTHSGPSHTTRIYHWDGTAWARIHSPNRGKISSQLSSVSCPSVNTCQAVGSSFKGARQRTLVETWDGSAWTITPSPNAPRYDNVLSGVSCASPTSCVAVGAHTDNFESPTTPLIESFDGTGWTIQSNPDLDSYGALSAVSCASATSCMATGLRSDGSNFTNLAESWDGVSWTVTPTPDPGIQLNELVAVSCTSSTNCVSVGAYDDASHKVLTLVETWDGSDWTVTTSPSTETSQNYLYGVSCASADSCIAAGFSIDGGLVLTGT